MGTASCVAALVYTEGLATAVDPGTLLVRPPWNLTNDVREAILRVRLLHAGIGVLLLAVAALSLHNGALARLLARPMVSRALLVLVALFPLWIVETSLGALVPIRGQIFEPDEELGWRLRPNSRGIWGRTMIEVNGKGLRGPEVDYAKPPGTSRILFLGDSVTFGFFVEEADTFPRAVQRSLERSDRMAVEIVNTGVGGYSPWQQKLYLEREGYRYEPDLVIVSFVLNDVTEKFRFARFGGQASDQRGSAQLMLTRKPRLRDRIAISRYLAQYRWLKRRRSGIEEGKTKPPESISELRWYHLLYRPDDPHVKKAWDVTLANLAELIDTCDSLRIPVVLVSFPFTDQALGGEAHRSPQRILAAFASQRSVAFLDLLPVLEHEAGARGVPFESYFIDDDHLSPLGAEVAGASIAAFLQEEGLVP
jgi:lysophospholipase L1-like esterase